MFWHLQVYIFTTSNQTVIPESQRIRFDLYQIYLSYILKPKPIIDSHVHLGSQVQSLLKPHETKAAKGWITKKYRGLLK